MSEQLEALVRLGRQIDGEMKELKDRRAEIVRLIDEATEVGWSLTVDGVPAVKRTGNRSFSVRAALSLFTEEQKLSCVSTAIDDKAVRTLAESLGVLEACMLEPEDGRTAVRLG